MGKRGPAPLPSNVKRLRGTYRADRAAPAEPAPDVVAPNCPRWLDPVAKREWRYVVRELVAMRVMARIDRDALAAYCQAYAEWRAMQEVLDLHGYIQIVGQSGYLAPRPEVAIRNKAIDRMHRYMREFGMTPSSRTRVSAKPEAAEPTNPFAKFGRGG